ncbi:MAG TPA: 4-(cytidine 5'-diphospho)-2-C-methyl-D-erythritol kinase [Clostridiaceae bacterium]|nr:4-(cytidine 5'-diphospho)-2-C-methyl-D-erythritol kinase [Clostridiaceae bacterium]
MNLITAKAHAKINLSLDVLGKREDGYHELRMIMQEVELHDIITVEIISKGIEICCNNPKIPTDEANTAYRAAKLLLDEYKIQKGVKISIEKRIPAAAGLGGGSSDAAAVLKSMNQLFNLGLGEVSLQDLSVKVGADVPFFVDGYTQLAEGIGEKLAKVASMKPLDILLVNPGIEVSTAWVYRNLNLNAVTERPDTELLINAVMQNDIERLARNMKNVLETVTEKKYGIISEIKRQLKENGALGSLMSGSGPTVFGIFRDASLMENARSKFKSYGYETILTRTKVREM